ncbi:MAG: hypothetical protein CSA52_03295 [Gammaproteobacteria bacterium]|nr:MAG: hypothetical protein CSB48_04025 [Pseudomonadota bacterium]PIE38220.1 MAG: hypothetical protein CSA52_03295 [Gammaproteobacteria bacterium]
MHTHHHSLSSFFTRYLLCTTVTLCAGISSAQAIETVFTLSDDSAYIKLSASPDVSKASFSAGYLYHQGARHVYHLDAHAQGQTAIGNLPTTTGIGIRGVGFHQKNIDGHGLGLGGFAVINIPEVPGLSVMGSLHYAPSITSFDDAEGIGWLELESRYRMIQNADVKLGYRYIKSGMENSKSQTLDSSFYLGVSLHF